MANDTSKKIKEKVRELKNRIRSRHTVGDPKMRGVKRPKRRRKMVGPRGGVFVQGGKDKEYVKKADSNDILELIEKAERDYKVEDFIQNFKGSKNEK